MFRGGGGGEVGGDNWDNGDNMGDDSSLVALSARGPGAPWWVPTQSGGQRGILGMSPVGGGEDVPCVWGHPCGSGGVPRELPVSPLPPSDVPNGSRCPQRGVGMRHSSTTALTAALGVNSGRWGLLSSPLWGCPLSPECPPPYSSAHGDPCPWGCPLSPECPLKLSSGRPLVPTMTPEIVPTVSPTPVATPYPLDVTYNYSQGTPYPCAPPMSPKSSSNASPFAPPPSPPPPPPTPPRLLSVPSQRDPFAAVPPPPTPSTWHCAVPSCPLTGSRSGESGREPGRPFLVGVLASLRGPCTRCRSRRSGVTHSSRRLLTGGGGGGSWGVAHRDR